MVSSLRGACLAAALLSSCQAGEVCQGNGVCTAMPKAKDSVLLQAAATAQRSISEHDGKPKSKSVKKVLSDSGEPLIEIQTVREQRMVEKDVHAMSDINHAIGDLEDALNDIQGGKDYHAVDDLAEAAEDLARAISDDAGEETALDEAIEEQSVAHLAEKDMSDAINLLEKTLDAVKAKESAEGKATLSKAIEAGLKALSVMEQVEERANRRKKPELLEKPKFGAGGVLKERRPRGPKKKKKGAEKDVETDATGTDEQKGFEDAEKQIKHHNKNWKGPFLKAHKAVMRAMKAATDAEVALNEEDFVEAERLTKGTLREFMSAKMDLKHKDPPAPEASGAESMADKAEKAIKRLVDAAKSAMKDSRLPKPVHHRHKHPLRDALKKSRGKSGKKGKVARGFFCAEGHVLEHHEQHAHHGDLCRRTDEPDVWAAPKGCRGVKGKPYTLMADSDELCRVAHEEREVVATDSEEELFTVEMNVGGPEQWSAQAVKDFLNTNNIRPMSLRKCNIEDIMGTQQELNVTDSVDKWFDKVKAEFPFTFSVQAVRGAQAKKADRKKARDDRKQAAAEDDQIEATDDQKQAAADLTKAQADKTNAKTDLKAVDEETPAVATTEVATTTAISDAETETNEKAAATTAEPETAAEASPTR